MDLMVEPFNEVRLVSNADPSPMDCFKSGLQRWPAAPSGDARKAQPFNPDPLNIQKALMIDARKRGSAPWPPPMGLLKTLRKWTVS